MQSICYLYRFNLKGIIITDWDIKNYNSGVCELDHHKKLIFYFSIV